MPLLDPVLIGDSGQVKEYREETTYGSIGDPHHRHISQLMGMYPGTLINQKTKTWLEGARVTLNGRGMICNNGWPLIHRFCLWARACDPENTMMLLRRFIQSSVMDNLWANHGVFQIEANFGYVSGVCEMLLQSQSGYIDLLPSCPKEWENGAFSGMVARGSFVVDCSWSGGTVKAVRVLSEKGGELCIKIPNGLTSSKPCARMEDGISVFETTENEVIVLE